MTDEEYKIRRKYENRNLMQELQWVSCYPPSGLSNQDKDFIRWLAVTAYDRINELERKHGKWVSGKCDQCGEHAPYWCMASTYCMSNFCPNCGADMRGDDDV